MKNNDFDNICDYKQCCKEGTIYIGDVVAPCNTWLSNGGDTPTLSIYMCKKHAKKFYKIINLPYNE